MRKVRKPYSVINTTKLKIFLFMRITLIFLLILFSRIVKSQTNTFPVSGNVGIGTTSPSFPLSVNGIIQTNYAFFTQGQTSVVTNQGGYVMWNYSANTDCCAGETDFINNQGLGTGGGFRWYNTPQSGSPANFLMSLTGNGNLGIGVSSPTERLTVGGINKFNNVRFTGNSSNGVGISLENTQTNGHKFDLLSGGSSNSIGAGNFAIYDETADSYLLTINTDGNVLIGKTSQANNSYKLDINGNVRANKIVVNTTGADFVFDSTYKLLTLDSLHSFIQKYHHLPAIASAYEMKKEGLNVGDNQTILLQKIEELTLYTIEQSKQTLALQNIVKDQNKKIDEQSKKISLLEATSKNHNK